MRNFTVRLMQVRKGEPDECVAELDVEGSERGADTTAAHYAKHARLFMRHIHFDYATATAR